MALLMIVVLECIVIGTLQLSLQEHRIAANRTSVLQLRLDAESGARRALGLWSVPIDSMPIGGAQRLMLPPHQTPGGQVTVERLDSSTFLLESVAAETAPRVGRSTSRLLVHPPVLPPGSDPAPAAASVAGAVHMLGSGVITTTVPAGCPRAAPSYGALAPPFTATIHAGAYIDAPIGVLDPGALIRSLVRVQNLWPAPVAMDTVLSTSGAGALLVSGNLAMPPGTSYSGLVIVAGSATIAAGAVLRGAIHTGGTLSVAGTIAWDGCAVDQAIDGLRLDRPTPAGQRPWLPAF